MTTEKKELRRSFGGKIDNFKDKTEKAFQQRHLKAYLKGNKLFRMGFDNNKKPNWYKVIEVWS